MKKQVAIAALLAITAAVPAQAHRATRHYHHSAMHGRGSMYRHADMSYPDTVTLEGKEYKVCKQGMMDDCVNPRQAGLNFGNMPIDSYRPHD